jgi:D-3-phosphoglycerate dehydrogenase
MNTPGGNVVTTAEHTIAMMMSLTRNIPRGTATLKAGKWEKKKLQGRELFNKTLGVIGFGKIGSIVADRARGLKMKVVVHDPFVNPDQIEKAGFRSVSMGELLENSDYITVHVPKLKQTIGILNHDSFEHVKEGVMVLNCARGGIIDEKALYDAIVSGRVAGAALDVFETEPPGDNPLLKLDQVICTPHLGASTREAQSNVAAAVAEQMIAFLKEGTVINAVNVPSVTGELLEKLSPFLTCAEKIGALQAQLVSGALKEVAIEYAGDFQGLDLTPVTAAVLKGLLTRQIKDDVNFVNAPVIARERGIRVSETTTGESEDYLNLITVKVTTTDMTNSVAGTIFGKHSLRIVKINTFRLEMIPSGHLALIHNIDRPGSIGQIGTVLGRHSINIGKMQVGQEEEGDRNIIFLSTDTPIPPDVQEELRQLSLVKTVTPLEF